jgi:serine/threonine protein phosphatase PrpC
VSSIYDKLTNEQLAAMVVSQAERESTRGSDGQTDPALIASYLLDASLRAGSRDNMSAIVIQYGKMEKKSNITKSTLSAALDFFISFLLLMSEF